MSAADAPDGDVVRPWFCRAADHVDAVTTAVEVVCYDGGMGSAVLLIGAE